MQICINIRTVLWARAISSCAFHLSTVGRRNQRLLHRSCSAVGTKYCDTHTPEDRVFAPENVGGCVCVCVQEPSMLHIITLKFSYVNKGEIKNHANNMYCSCCSYCNPGTHNPKWLLAAQLWMHGSQGNCRIWSGERMRHSMGKKHGKNKWKISRAKKWRKTSSPLAWQTKKHTHAHKHVHRAL